MFSHAANFPVPHLPHEEADQTPIASRHVDRLEEGTEEDHHLQAMTALGMEVIVLRHHPDVGLLHDDMEDDQVPEIAI